MLTAATLSLFQSTPPVKAATQIIPPIIAKQGFQSTPPVKAATTAKYSLTQKLAISIHAAREGGDGELVKGMYSALISIHAAREGGDITEIAMAGIKYEFQSTPPVKAATL